MRYNSHGDVWLDVLSAEELRDKLTELIEQGHGDDVVICRGEYIIDSVGVDDSGVMLGGIA